MITKNAINFMGEPHRRVLMYISLVLTVLSLISLGTKGLKFGLDFTGGTSLELRYAEAPDLKVVRETLVAAGYPSAVVVNFGGPTDILVRVQSSAANNELGQVITEILRKASGQEITIKQSEYVGPHVGEELLNSGGIGLLVAILGVFLYVAMRFQFKFALGSILALMHDVVLILGVFSFFQLDFDLTVLAAVLTIIGLTINESIIVADRVRENLRIMRGVDVKEVINTSITQTLSRTIMTSGSINMSVLAMFFLGGEAFHHFSLALLFGVTFGNYSSVYIASGLLITFKVTREDLIPAEVVQDEVDEMP